VKAGWSRNGASIYVPKVAYRKIREIANTEDRKPHDVLMEGVDLVLA
jgi:hypothetical protein